MPKTRRNARSDLHNSDSATFDPTTPSTWSSASRSQLQSLTVATLQQELKARNLRCTGNKAVLSQRLHDALQLPADATTQRNNNDSQSDTGPASATPTQHTNLTTSQNDAQMNETLRLLSLQLQQLPPQQLSTLLLQAISGGTQTPASETIVNNPAPPASQNQPVIPTSGQHITPSSQSRASFNLPPPSQQQAAKHTPTNNNL